MQRLLASWILVATAILPTRLLSGAPRWAGPAAVAPPVLEFPAVPAARSSMLPRALDAALYPRTQLQLHAAQSAVALPPPPPPSITPGPRIHAGAPLLTAQGGGWPFSFPYYPTGPPTQLS